MNRRGFMKAAALVPALPALTLAAKAKPKGFWALVETKDGAYWEWITDDRHIPSLDGAAGRTLSAAEQRAVDHPVVLRARWTPVE